MKHLTETALSLLPPESADALVLSVDDTLTEKFGDKFEYWGKLYDHAAHNGSKYLNGHCFVSLMLSVPPKESGGYLSFPIAYRMYTKKQSKPEMAAELVRNAMETLGSTRQVILCCDSWYPKDCVKRLVDEYPNLDIICNVRACLVSQNVRTMWRFFVKHGLFYRNNSVYFKEKQCHMEENMPCGVCAEG